MKKARLFFAFVLFAVILAGCGGSGVGEPKVRVTQAEGNREETEDERREEPAPPMPDYAAYEATLDVDPSTLWVTGVEKITFINRTGADLETIYINVYANAFDGAYDPAPYFPGQADKVFENGVDYGWMTVLNVLCGNEEADFTLEGSELRVTPAALAPAGKPVEILIQFEAKAPRINHVTGANEHAAWFGHFLPTLAVYDKEGWHTNPFYPAGLPFYTETASFDVRVKTPPGYTVAGTGRETVTETQTEKTTTLSARLARDFAFYVSAGAQKDAYVTDSGVEICLYHYSELENAEALLKLAGQALDYYGEKILTYPFAHLDIVETGLHTGGVLACPEIIFIDSDCLTKDTAGRAVMYGAGRQWFGNVIGANQAKEPWLSEGLNELTLARMLYGGELDAAMAREHALLAGRIGSAGPSRLADGAGQYESWADYYSVQHVKSKLMAYALMRNMGEETFDAFLKLYGTRYAFKTAGRDGFSAVAEEAFGGGLAAFFQEWIDEPGLPPLSVAPMGSEES